MKNLDSRSNKLEHVLVAAATVMSQACAVVMSVLAKGRSFIYHLPVVGFAVFFAASPAWEDTIRGVITCGGMGVQGYRVTAVQEVRAGYKIDTEPCTVSHPNIQTLGSVNTGPDGSFVLPYTAATKPPGACSFSTVVYIKVFDGTKLLWTSPKKSAAHQVTFNYERGGRCPCNSIPANAIGKDPLIILMSPNGDDNNCGFTLDTPVLTLERVEEVIASAVPNRDKDVEVRIGAGTYRDQVVVWTFTMPNHTITFMPLFNDKNRPVFDGSSTTGAIWFRLDHTNGQKTNLVFRYLRVENYSYAIDLHGNYSDEQRFNSHNEVYGSYFFNIGEGATSAVGVTNSRDNRIVNNHFINILTSGGCGHLHALYIAHWSSGNQILRNRFENNCGDPIRIRDYSNGNIINENVLTRVGITAAYTDWYCDHDTRTDCSKPQPECPSWDNQFRNNTLDGNYGGQRLKVFHYFQDERATGCSRPSRDSRRLRTSGNVHR